MPLYVHTRVAVFGMCRSGRRIHAVAPLPRDAGINCVGVVPGLIANILSVVGRSILRNR